MVLLDMNIWMHDIRAGYVSARILHNGTRAHRLPGLPRAGSVTRV